MIEFIEPPELFDVSVDPGASTALHLAIAHSHSEVVDVLLNHKGKERERRYGSKEREKERRGLMTWSFFVC